MERKLIYYDKEQVERLKQEYPACAVWLQNGVDKLCKLYNQMPFHSAEKKKVIQKLKEVVTFYNPNWEEEERSKQEWKDKKKQEKENEKQKKREEYRTNESREYDYSNTLPKTLKERYIDLLKDKKWGDASELLANHLGNKLKLYTTKDDQKSEMWVYKDGIYVPQGKSEIKEQLRLLLGKWYSMWMFNQVVAKIEADTFIEQEKFFEIGNPEELPVKNGILNVITKQLSPFTPNKVFFNKLPVNYNPLSSCPQIEQFLIDVLSDESDRAVFYEMGGFCLLKEYKFEKAFMLVGNGRNGKDKSLELIKRCIGIENCCSVPLSALSSESFIISEFFGKMANVAGDIDHQDLKDTSEFKSLTGRSLKTAPRKFLKPITFVNHAKFIFACNDLPMVYDTSKGFWDRWVLLEYPYTFVTKEELEKTTEKTNIKLRDENIIEKITSPDELSGLLNKFLDGLDRLLEKRGFSSTKGSEEIKNTWIRKANSFMAFCSDRIESDYDKFITKKDLRRKYANYCKKYHLLSKSDLVIKRTLEELHGAVEGYKNTENNITERVWEGIKWKESL
jgi:putative DNA primase/helicase